MRLAFVACALLVFLWSGPALALHFDGSTPIELDLTETADVDYHFQNGNGIVAPPGSVSYDPTSNNYLDWLNRFEAQLTAGPWHADLRFDSALFANTPTVTDTQTSEGQRLFFLLENRYVDNFEVAKISASYLGQKLEATLGDFYVTYGRGLVLSLRKIDQLGVDTTLRGGTVTVRLGSFTASAAGGITNVVNTDPALGAVAPSPEDPVVGARMDYRFGQALVLGLEGAVIWQNPNTAQYTRYSPGEPTQQVPISPLGIGDVTVLSTSQLPHALPASETGNFGGTLELSNLWGHGNAYVEVVHQLQENSGIQTDGNGVYAGADAYFTVPHLPGQFTLQAEFKDYDSFVFPVLSSLSSTTFLAFYQQDVYSNPPNLEEIWQEETATEHIYGPRLRVDWQASEHVKPYAAFSWFRDTDNGYDITNASLGVDANWQDHRSHASVSAGYRCEAFNSSGPELTFAAPSCSHASEYWAQYDLVQVLTYRWALELEGLHRTHSDYVFSPDYHLWNQGDVYLSVRQSRWSGSVGYEYYSYDPAVYQVNNFNVSGTFNVNQSWLLRGFLGSREAGLRCINGVCRNFPGFNGATVEIVAKY